MSGLRIIIDEEDRGFTKRNKTQKFALQENGTASNGSHEIILIKDINKTHHYYFRDKFSFNKYIDVEKHPKKIINIVKILPKNRTFPSINFKIYKHIKLKALAKRTGLLKELKLQHNGSWNMSIDDKYIYIITTASDRVWSKKDREKDTGEFLEIYDIDTLKLKQHIKLGEDTKSFTYFKGFATDENFIYIGTESGYSIYYDNIYKKNKRVRKRGKLNGADITFKNGDSIVNGYDRHDAKVSDVKIYNNKLFTISEDGKVGMYKKFQDGRYHFKAMLNTKKHYPKSYEKLKDKRYGHLFDLVVHKNIAYISSDIGVIFKFDLNYDNPKFVGWIDTIYYDEEYKQYSGLNINSMQIYKDRYLLFTNWFDGLSMYDMKTDKFVFSRKNLYPKKIGYSELFKEEFDATKTTDIYKFLLYKDCVVFTETNKEVVVYDLKKEKIIYKFLGIDDDVSDIEIFKNKLFALAGGSVYVFDLSVIGK